VYTFSKNDVILSVRKRFCALGLGLEIELGLELVTVWVRVSAMLAEIRFRSKVFSSKRSRFAINLTIYSNIIHHQNYVTEINVIIFFIFKPPPPPPNTHTHM